MNISFEKAKPKHQATIFNWLQQPHVTTFWDNSQAHKNDILNFLDGRKTPSNYADGKDVYFIGSVGEPPHAMIMTIMEKAGENPTPMKNEHVSKTGTTYSIDFMIGNPSFVGKGLGGKTLKLFVDFFV